MQSSCEVAIIGGGVIGLACAWRLAQAGARVQLFERGEIGREASHAAAGMLAAQCEAAVHPPTSLQPEYSDEPNAFLKLCLQSRDLYAAFAAELLDETGIDVELSIQNSPTKDWREPGILYVSNSGDELVMENFLAQRAFGQRAEYSDFNGSRALFLPNEGQVENRKLVAALKKACEISGVVLNENQAAQPQDLANQFDAVLLCAGSWSTPDADETPIVRPVAGEVLAVRPPQRLEKIIYSRDVYLVPRRDGRVLIGATMAERGFDKSVSSAAKTQLLNAAAALIPGAQNWPIEEHWAGLRPATINGLPILGHVENQNYCDNLFVATGHFRNGILLTPITSQIMANCILNDASAPEEFSISRFDSISGDSEKCGQGKQTSCA